ncbi:MAG TPA: carboxylating nicotinate-nucleotide diphosphorylase [Bryobacteraceae bacterium]|nr:carboxylating nicotinate-nucleotide diphosphorylase [Bryobacteraceae bacterium]
MTAAEIVANALAEDVGTGDVTTELCVPADRRAIARFIAREHAVLAGVQLLPLLYDDVEISAANGSLLKPGDEIAIVRGSARQLLTRERVSLNFLQHLSGIATLARKFVDAVAGTKCRVLDTRKTTPGLRQLEKDAARAGGATNHRMGLYDAVLIKNNHITAAGGVRAALEAARAAHLPVEIEVRTRAELDEALACGAKSLLLDNLTPAMASEWIAHIAGRATVELSGGITLENARAYAEGGADFISSGAITHSAQAVDIHCRLELA